MRGPAPKPTELKRLAGNPGCRPLPKDEPKPAAVLPKCPTYLKGDARKEWRRLTQELYALGILTEIDIDALAVYCQVWDRWLQAERHIKAEGAVIITSTGYPAKSAWMTIADKCIAQMKVYMAEFGMTPSSRTRVHAEKQETEKSLAEMLFESND